MPAIRTASDAARAEQSVQRVAGLTTGARVAPHLRPAGADHQLLEQLRPYQFPEKLIHR